MHFCPLISKSIQTEWKFVCLDEFCFWVHVHHVFLIIFYQYLLFLYFACLNLSLQHFLSCFVRHFGLNRCMKRCYMIKVIIVFIIKNFARTHDMCLTMFLTFLFTSLVAFFLFVWEFRKQIFFCSEKKRNYSEFLVLYFWADLHINSLIKNTFDLYFMKNFELFT